MGRVEELKPAICVSSCSEFDDEANEDVSLNIVERSLLMRAVILAEDDYQDIGFVHDIVYGYNNHSENSGVLGVNDGGDKRVDASSNEEDKAGNNSAAASVAAEIDENVDPTFVQKTDNMVQRKLRRGWRYFDPPDSGWLLCYKCGEDGHMAVNCASAQKKKKKQKKPCFLCGSSEHEYNLCFKERKSSICKAPGHHPINVPQKYNGGPLTSKVCLKCGDGGHDMFSCDNSYSVDDLKEIQCYLCKRFGHLCCVNILNDSPRIVSCYKCGEVGHTGLECSGVPEEAITEASPSTSCHNSTEGGHLACECATSVKAGEFNNESLTLPLKSHQDMKGAAEMKFAPVLG